MKKLNWKDILVSAAALTVIAGVTTAALAGTNALTADTIHERARAAEDQARRRVLIADEYVEKTVSADGAETVYHEALRGGAVVGYVFTAEAAGKSSGMVVMTGIRANGTITGVVVTEDNETAGYLQKVEKGGLMTAFRDREADEFKLGEDVDAVSNATKTSKGVVSGVNQAVACYRLIKANAG